jgi:hypothetical protein
MFLPLPAIGSLLGDVSQPVASSSGHGLATEAVDTSGSSSSSPAGKSLKESLEIVFSKCGLRVGTKFARKTAGALWGVCACGYLFPPKELPDSESTRMVLLYIIELFKGRVYCTRGGKLLVLFDDMCHLLRMAIANMGHHPEIRRFVEEAEHAVDRFHFHKNHKGRWCKLLIPLHKGFWVTLQCKVFLP